MSSEFSELESLTESELRDNLLDAREYLEKGSAGFGGEEFAEQFVELAREYGRRVNSGKMRALPEKIVAQLKVNPKTLPEKTRIALQKAIKKLGPIFESAKTTVAKKTSMKKAPVKKTPVKKTTATSAKKTTRRIGGK